MGILFKEFIVQVRNSPFEKSLLNKIARVANGLEREVEKELKVSYALTFSQFRVLNGLLVLGEASQRELASSLDVTPAVITRQADVLAGRGLVLQRINPKSKREKVLALTKKGEKAAGDARQTVKQAEAHWREKIEAQDEAAFDRTIDVLMKALG
jgi:DNA-binding MarR family transcriptional regulator